MAAWPPSRVEELRGKIVGCCMLGRGHAHATQEAAEWVLGEWANVTATISTKFSAPLCSAGTIPLGAAWVREVCPSHWLATCGDVWCDGAFVA